MTESTFAHAVLAAAARGVDIAMRAYFDATGADRAMRWHDLTEARQRLSHTLDDLGTERECPCGTCERLRREVRGGEWARV